ncbi:MAG: hypothetical protein WD407_06685 [Rhodospirillales bacterium]
MLILRQAQDEAFLVIYDTLTLSLSKGEGETEAHGGPKRAKLANACREAL